MAKAKQVNGLKKDASTVVNARLIAATRLEELYHWFEDAHGSADGQELHTIRIAAKRLRYTLEIFMDVLPKAMSLVLEELTQLQDALGALHDSDVLLQLLHLSIYQDVKKDQLEKAVEVDTALTAHLLKVVPSDEVRQSLERYVLRVQNQRAERYRSFQLLWQRLQERGFRQEVEAMLKQ